MTRTAARLGLHRNPLRRWTDRVEAAVTVVLILVTVTAGPLLVSRAATAAYRSSARAVRIDRPHRFRVDAVLQRDARDHVDASDEVRPRMDPVPARWTAPDGTPRTGGVEPPTAVPAGSVVRIWTDAHGNRLGPGPQDPHASAVEAGLATAVGFTLGVYWLRRTVRRRLDRRRLADWQTQWMLVEPRWSGRR